MCCITGEKAGCVGLNGDYDVSHYIISHLGDIPVLPHTHARCDATEPLMGILKVKITKSQIRSGN